MRCRAHRQPREEHREYHPKLRGRSLEPLGGNYAKRRLFVANTPRERREAADCALSGGNASPSGSPGGRPVTPSQAPAAITPDSQPTETKRIKPSVPSGGGTRSQIPTGKLPPPPSPAFPDMAKPSPPQPQVRRPVWLRRKLPRLLQNRRPPAIRAARSNGQARSAAATPSAAKVVAPPPPQPSTPPPQPVAPAPAAAASKPAAAPQPKGCPPGKSAAVIMVSPFANRRPPWQRWRTLDPSSSPSANPFAPNILRHLTSPRKSQ
jgi:hypothetical protein